MEELKRTAAYEAVADYAKDGMTLGLGSGTTASWVVRRIGELLADGKLRDVRGVPTSEDTAALARKNGVPLVSLAEARPDLTIDGADEVDSNLNLLKGYGGALLREKIVAAASRDGMVVVADGSKYVATLGNTGPLPVEVDPFGWEATLRELESLGCEPRLRLIRGQPLVTDGGHYTVDCLFPSIVEPVVLEAKIKRIPGALECGLFVGLTQAAVIARDQTEAGTEVIELWASAYPLKAHDKERKVPYGTGNDAPASRRGGQGRLRRWGIQRQQPGADTGDHGGRSGDGLSGNNPGE